MRDQLSPQQTSENPNRLMPSPPADRLTRSRWLDLRLALGVLLVLASVVTGSRLIAAADDTVPRLAAAVDLRPGMEISDKQVVERSVRLEDVDSAYFAGPVPPGYVVIRPVVAGELIPRSAIAPASAAGQTRYLTVAIPEAELPAMLGPADRVDVWTLRTATDDTATATLAATDVTVVDTGEANGPFGGGSGARAVTLALRQGDLTGSAFQQRLAGLVAAGRSGAVYLTAMPEVAGAAR